MSENLKRTSYDRKRCVDCGVEVPVVAKNTLYCSLCRLGRGAKWHDLRTSKCQECGQPYIAWNGVKSQRWCGTCLMAHAKQGQRESVEDTCMACIEEGDHDPKWVHSPGLHVCFPHLHAPAWKERMKATILLAYEDRKNVVS